MPQARFAVALGVARLLGTDGGWTPVANAGICAWPDVQVVVAPGIVSCATWRQDLLRAWSRARRVHWRTFQEIQGREPAPAMFVLIRATMSDATFCRLIKSHELWWTMQGCALLEKDIDLQRAGEDGEPLYSVWAEVKAAPPGLR